VSGLLTKSLKSSTFKVALACITLFGAMVLALFSYVYLATDDYVINRSDQAINADRMDLIHIYSDKGSPGLVHAIEEFQAESARLDSVYLLADASFQRIAGNLEVWPEAARGASGHISFTGPGRPAHFLDRPDLRASLDTLADGTHLLVGRDVSDLNAFMDKIHLALALVLLLVFLLAAVAAAAVTRRTLGRIESISTTTHAIMQSGLGRRVPLRGTSDEWDQLASNLNSMLDRIEALMAEVRHVTDNVAHDLRTPLARLRGRLEKASFGPRTAKTDQVLISESIADLDDVLRMFASMMRISQVESTDRTSAFRDVDLAEIGRGVAELFDAAAEIRQIKLTVRAETPAIIVGDRDLLFEAMANLIDNAVKHGREGGQVDFQIAKCHDRVVLRVLDNGPGIPESEHQNVFRRFYRLESSRATPGNGLGLSFVAAVARLHGAAVKLRSNEPGIEVELQFATSRQVA
jgi:signal transduction histidine kinase